MDRIGTAMLLAVAVALVLFPALAGGQAPSPTAGGDDLGAAMNKVSSSIGGSFFAFIVLIVAIIIGTVLFVLFVRR